MQVVSAEVHPAVIAAGEEEVHVKEGFGTTQPCTSTAVAVTVSDVPLLTEKLVSLELIPTCREMHWTGQLSKV